VESRIKSHALKYDVIIQSSTSRSLRNGFVLASIIVQFVATYFSTCDVDKPNELLECSTNSSIYYLDDPVRQFPFYTILSTALW
jgi:hypothetical protein